MCACKTITKDKGLKVYSENINLNSIVSHRKELIIRKNYSKTFHCSNMYIHLLVENKRIEKKTFSFFLWSNFSRLNCFYYYYCCSLQNQAKGLLQAFKHKIFSRLIRQRRVSVHSFSFAIN